MLWVKEIDYKTAKGFIEEHHYSHKMPRGYSVCFGWYDGETLYAVANFGVGVNMMAHEYLAENTTLPVTQFNLFELKRLCRVGEKEDPSRYPLTQFLSVCHKILRKESGIEFVISFSDPEHGHEGELYRIANFIRLGSTTAEVHYAGPDGTFVHRRVPYRQMQRYNINRAYELYPREMEQACESERVALNVAAGSTKYKAVTMEMQHRNAKRLLGKDAKTFRQAVEDGRFTKRTTIPKTRWFLPLIPEHRNKLETLLKTGWLTITKKGEMSLGAVDVKNSRRTAPGPSRDHNSVREARTENSTNRGKKSMPQKGVADVYIETTDSTRGLLRASQYEERRTHRIKPDPETHPESELETTLPRACTSARW